MPLSRPKGRKSKYPKIDFGYESVDYPGLYFVGTATHSLDLRKSAGGFIHGFRYSCEYNTFARSTFTTNKLILGLNSGMA